MRSTSSCEHSWQTISNPGGWAPEGLMFIASTRSNVGLAPEEAQCSYHRRYQIFRPAGARLSSEGLWRYKHLAPSGAAWLGYLDK
jgi:hypothetical protein